MSKVLINQDLFNNVNYDMEKTQKTSPAGDAAKQPTVLIVFSHSDINAAIYHLMQSLESPFAGNAIATVLVQEAIKGDFIQKLQLQLKPYDKEAVTKNAQFANALSVAKKINAKTVTVSQGDSVGPTLVCDFTHEHFGGTEPSGLVTLHTFRTAKEAIALVNKESIKFSNVSIWHENHAYAYELVAALKSSNFFVNCYHVPVAILEESIKQGKSFVVMDKNYHYETMPCDGLQKSVVFPIGSIFAN